MVDRTCTYRDPHHTECCTECGQDMSLCTCVGLDELAHDRLTSVDGMFLRMVRDEVAASRASDPEDLHRLATLAKGAGDLAATLMDHDRALGTSSQEVLRDAVKVAATAVRLATEGDGNFAYQFPIVEEELPRGPVGGRYD